jgi:transcriptional regulator with XRE-family HTH domain
MMPYKNAIPNNLKECRKKAGLTQYEVMVKLGLKSMDRISKWERGRKYPNVINFLDLLEIYEASPRNYILKLNNKAYSLSLSPVFRNSFPLMESHQ